MNQDNIAKLMKRAQKAFAAGDRAGARKQYERILAINPRHLDANYLLGSMLAEEGRFDPAEKYLRYALDLHPTSDLVLTNLGTLLRQRGEYRAALGLYQRAIAMNPDNMLLYLNLGLVCNSLGHYQQAEAHLMRYLAYRPGDLQILEHLGYSQSGQGKVAEAERTYRRYAELFGMSPSLQHLIDACSGTTTEHAPPEYVRGLFDQYAGRFEAHLLKELEYRAPAAIVALLNRLLGEQAPLGRVADLGCGTGLMGLEIVGRCGSLAGVDLSAGMIEEARRKGCYTDLHQQDVVQWLAGQAGLDLLLCADVLIYVGATETLFDGVAAALAPGGLFVFSVEDLDGPGYVLRPSGRYAHSLAYLRGTAAAAGLSWRHQETLDLRKEHNAWIAGRLVALEKPSSHPSA